MRKLFLSVMALSLLFTACDSCDDDKVYTEAEKIEKDVNGEYLFTKALLGDLPVVEISYNSDNQISVVSSYNSDKYEQKLTGRVEKEYKDGKVNKITTRSIVEDYQGETKENVGSVLLSYDSKGNLIKIEEWEDEESDVSEYIQNAYNSKNLLIKSELYYLDKTESDDWQKENGYLKYEYNSDDLITNIIGVNSDDEETVLTDIKYDEKKNPVEIYKYNSPEYDWKINPVTGEQEKFVVEEGKLVSIVKIEYDYSMKNFLGHSIGLIFPELIQFNFKNAPKRITQTGTVVAGSITYSDFNEGGYPQSISFLGNSDDGETYSGEVNLEFIKKK
ncbi:hypothetical protein [Labilibaculum manganireducens]|uniref:hypothetical protein n=1 Tax=Labilibaculum manganireducens TaxID=1940525 RepID=UPI0029F56D48|nr:hypothetical protein [Labilibaculum manganireducens]